MNVGFEVFTAVVMKSIISLLSSACHLLARWFAEPISSTLKMEAVSSSTDYTASYPRR
jgi:hypothetical protein